MRLQLGQSASQSRYFLALRVDAAGVFICERVRGRRAEDGSSAAAAAEDEDFFTAERVTRPL